MAKLHNGEVPGDHHGYDFLFARLQSEFDGNGPSDFFACADPRGVAVRQRSIFGERIPNGFAVTVREKLCLIENLDARGFDRSDGEFAIPFVYHAIGAIAVEDDAFHLSDSRHVLPAKLILIALAEGRLKIMGVRAKPSVHVGPRQQDGDSNCCVRRVFCVPAVDRDRVARFFVIVGKHGRKLFQHDMGRESVPLVIVPGLWKERGVLARAHGVVPLPAG